MNIAQALHNISYCSELLAYLVTILFYAKRKNIVSFILLVLMSMIFVTETLGKYKQYFPSYHNIFLAQNIEMLIEIFLFLAVYYFSVISAVFKNRILLMMLFYVAFAVTSSFLWQPLHKMFPTYSLVVGGLFILIAIQIYFYEGLKNVDQFNFYKSYLFYISIGLFIFYANEMPVMTLFNYFLNNNMSVDKIGFVFNLKLIVSIVFYSLYSFGILWTTKN
jgi:hypothetical protein